MIKIGVLGADYIENSYIDILKKSSEFDLTGIYDSNPQTLNKIEKEYSLKAYPSVNELADDVDAFIILYSNDCNNAINALKKSKPVFLANPLNYSTEDALNLIKLANEANVIVQISSVERYNPALIAANPHINNPMFIETSRLAQISSQCTNTSVVLDLMIQDIDIVLSQVKSNVKKINANGMSIINDTPDIANARLEFDNGCVANLTASRISKEDMHKCRFTQKDAYISVNLLKQQVEIAKINTSKNIAFNKLLIKKSDKIEEELLNFHNSINSNSAPISNIEKGYQTLIIAQNIIEKIKLTANKI